MIKVLLIWLAVLAVTFFLSMRAGTYSSGQKFWFNVFMWTLILGGLAMLGMCFGGSSGEPGSYGNSGYR